LLVLALYVHAVLAAETQVARDILFLSYYLHEFVLVYDLEVLMFVLLLIQVEEKL